MSNDSQLNMDQLRADLHRSEEELSPEVVQRLQAMRRDAIRAADDHRKRSFSRWLGWPTWAATGALASTVLVTTLMFQSSSLTMPVATGVELELAQEIAADMELLEDLEFVAWMVALENENAPTSANPTIA